MRDFAPKWLPCHFPSATRVPDMEPRRRSPTYVEWYDVGFSPSRQGLRVSGFNRSPKLIKGGIVLLDAGSGKPLRVIALQYNPEKLTRSLQAQFVEAGGQNRSEALRLTGPPVETIKLEATIDATDQLEKPNDHRIATQVGIHPQLCALESMIYPHSTKLEQAQSNQGLGMLEIAPMEAPLSVFVWGKSRIAPVRLTEYSVNEEFFDAELNPIRAQVSLGMRVLSVSDLGHSHRGGSLYMAYQKSKEQLADTFAGGDIRALGIGGLPV